MIAARASILALAAFLAAPVAAAARDDDPEAPPAADTPEQEEAKFRYRFPLVPTFDFSGSTDGSAAIRAGIAITFAPGTPLLDLTISNGFEIESFDALQTLAGLGPEGATPPTWGMRFGLAIVALPLPPPGSNPFADEGWMEALGEAVQACSSVCTALPDAEGCEGFNERVEEIRRDRAAGWCGVHASADFPACMTAATACLSGGGDSDHPACRAADDAPSPSEVDGDDLCAEGRSRLEPIVRNRVVQRYPPFLLALGGRVGQSPFSYAIPDESVPANATVGFGGRLVAVETAQTAWAAGGKWALISDRKAPLSFEGMVSFEQSWAASPASIEWCSSDDRLVDTGSGESVLRTQTCESAVLGGPTRERTLRIAVFPGFFDRWKDFWRVAAGPELALVWRGEAEQPRVDFALRVPARIHFGRIPAKEGGTAWNALLRLEPVFRWTDLAGDAGFAVGLDFSVVGQRLLFSEEFDSL